MTSLWKQLDISQSDIFHIQKEDGIFYAREYTSHGSYNVSEANQLIKNFKKSLDRKNRPEWKYKIEAIKKFARELSDLFDDEKQYVIAAIPSSIRRIDPNYDTRLDDTLNELRKIKPNIIIEEPIIINNNLGAAHLGGTRKIDLLYNNMSWVGFCKPTNHVILIDDVITTGSHFKACQKIILEHHPDIEIIGIFWAKTIWDSAHYF